MFRLATVPMLAAAIGGSAFAQIAPLPTNGTAPAAATPAPATATPAPPAKAAPDPVALPIPVSPAPPLRPASAAPVPFSPPPGQAGNANANTGQNTVQLQFGPSSDVKDVLRLYETLTGRRLVYDNQVVGPVPIVVNERVAPEEALKIIEISLLMNGFSLVPTEDKHIWKVYGIGKSPKIGGVPLYTDVDLIPENEQIVTVLFKLHYADPQELGTTLSQAFPANPVLAGQSIIPLPKSQALLVTENTPILRQLVRVIHELDLPPAKVESKFFALERADAKDVQEKLENILTKKAAGQTTAPVPGAAPAVPRAQVNRLQTTPEGLPLPANAPPDSGATTVEISAGPNEENIILGKIQITADTRTNRIHIVTRPANMEFISSLIKDFDANVPFGIPAVRPLKFVNASDIFQVIVKSISEPGQDKDTGGAGGGTRPNSNSSRGNATNNNLFNNNNNNSNTGFGNEGGFGGGGGGGSATLSESLTAEEKDIKPDAVTVGNTRIIADNRANSIIVVGNRDVKEKIFKVIDKLDVRAPQVMLHTCIGQLTLDDKEQFGVNYILRYGGKGLTATNGIGTGVGTGTGGTGTGAAAGDSSVIGIGGGGNPTLNIGNLLSQSEIKQIAIAGSSGLSGFFTAGDAFNAIVTALENSNKFKVTSRPSLFASNNKKAVISSGSEIAIPTNIQAGFNGGGGVGNNNNLVTNSSVQFKTVALQLEILPLINSEREVTLDIVQKIDEVSGSTTIDNNEIPTIATRVLKTTVSVPNRATLVLGGLIKQSYNKSHAGVPYLARIPLIGGLFRNTTSEKTREELVILIRPEVTMGPSEAVRAGEHDQESMDIEPDLEGTLIPTNLRQRVAPEELLRAPAQPGLREYSGRPAFKK